MSEPLALLIIFGGALVLGCGYVLVEKGLRMAGIRNGTTVWIEHTDQGDVYHRIKFVFERPPGEIEHCRMCAKPGIVILGNIIQFGFLDDEIYALGYCDHCRNYTCFKYHVEHTDMVLPEGGTYDYL